MSYFGLEVLLWSAEIQSAVLILKWICTMSKAYHPWCPQGLSSKWPLHLPKSKSTIRSILTHHRQNPTEKSLLIYLYSWSLHHTNYDVQAMFQHLSFTTNLFSNLHFLLKNMNLMLRIFSVDHLCDASFAEIVCIYLLRKRSSVLSLSTWN
jgi:hypothetical protein